MITVQKLALAIQKRFGGTEAEAGAESRTGLSYFGFRGRNDQRLSAPRANRGDDAAAGRELKSPRIRDFGGPRRRHDDVVRIALGVPETAISDHHGHAGKAGASKV